MDFKIKGFKINQNLFQTADLNKGVRLELSERYYPALLWTENDIIKTIDKMPELSQNINYNLKISFINKKYICFKLQDGNKKYIGIKKFKHKVFNPDINKIVIGAGGVPDRFFNGEITNASVKYSVYKLSFFRLALFIIVEFILLFFTLYSLFCIVKDKFCINKDKNDLSSFLILNGAIIYYPTFLYLRNIFEMDFFEYFCTIILLCTIFSFLYFILSKIFKNRNSLIFILLIIYFILSFSGILLKNTNFDYLELRYLKYLLLYFSISIFLFLINIDIKNEMKKTFSVLISVLFIILFINSSVNIINFIKLKTNKNIISKQKISSKNLPNLYIIIPDAYANSKNLLRDYNFDNDKFLNFLKQKGFYIIEDSHSNYPYTLQSLPSIVNFSYLKDLGIKNNIEGSEYTLNAIKVYNNSKLFKLFKEKGYEINFLNSDGVISTNPNNVDNKYINVNVACSISRILKEKSIFKSKTDDTFDLHFENIKKGFSNLENISSKKTDYNRLIFAHIEAPHPPFVFDKNGNRVNRDYYTSITSDDKYIHRYWNKEAFVEHTQYVNSKLEKIIDLILKNDNKSIIIITSDHSLRPYSYQKIENSKLLQDDMEHIEQRLGNFMAVYSFDRDYSNLYTTMTPVTLLRTILNQYFDENLDIPKDYIYLTSEGWIYNPIDVTNLLIHK